MHLHVIPKYRNASIFMQRLRNYSQCQCFNFHDTNQVCIPVGCLPCTCCPYRVGGRVFPSGGWSASRRVYIWVVRVDSPLPRTKMLLWLGFMNLVFQILLCEDVCTQWYVWEVDLVCAPRARGISNTRSENRWKSWNFTITTDKQINVPDNYWTPILYLTASKYS